MNNLALELIVLEAVKRIEQEIVEATVDPNMESMGESLSNDAYINGLQKAIEICKGLMK